MTVLLTILGGAAAAIWVPMVEVSREIIPRKHQGKALGLMSSGTSYRVFINSVLLTTMLSGHGWRSLWMVTCAIVPTLALIGLWRLRDAAPRTSTETTVQADKPSVRERLRTMPKVLAGSILFMMFLNGLSCMPFQTYLSAFLQSEAGHPTKVTAEIWRVIALVGMVSGFAVGALADRITVRPAMGLTYTILAFACYTLVAPEEGGGTIGLYAAAVSFGVAFYAIFGLVPAYIAQAFGSGNAALVFAFGNIALGIGGTAGNVLGGTLKETTGSFVPIYMVMLGAAVLSALLSLAMPNERSFEAKNRAVVT
ncbi:MFS transporter [Mesorhizobium sp. 1B3]|uniref:MFS transporter n=1 Tax=Mesorhizobium sp. 1B3 TaxID=3243599 RepID=UPI003D99A1CF